MMASKPSRLGTSCDGEPPAPKSRLKFLCSYGGKILPCPPDGRLKYVGGDNRVLVVPRTVSFAELKKKIFEIFHTDSVIKYQLAKATDFDVLISVTGDEDLLYMIDEYDLLEALSPSSLSSTTSPRFRLYIFPSSSSAAALATAAPPPDTTPFYPCCCIDMQYAGRQSIYTVSSSPATSPTCTIDGPAALFRQRTTSAYRRGDGMHRVHSSPNLGGAGGGAVASSAMYNVIKHHHQQQQHHQHQQLRSQLNSAVTYGGGSGLGRATGPAVRQETCGSCGCSCLSTWQRPPH